MYFRAQLETEKNDERIMFLSAKDIIQAMDVTKKIRKSRIITLNPINYETYMKGVDKKYQPN